MLTVLTFQLTSSALNTVIATQSVTVTQTTSKVVDSPARTLSAVQQAQDVIIVDFDETLFLRNSTEAYLDAIHPRPAGALFLLALKLIRPWRRLPKRLRKDELSKDWSLVLLATLFFPWTPFVWQRKAKRLARTYWNRPLLEAIARNPNAQVVVATLGFSWIVNPLLKHLPNEVSKKIEVPAVACGLLSGAGDRAIGKLKMTEKVLGKPALSKAVVVTDSATDMPLLNAVETPCLVQWPEAKYVPAMAEYSRAISTLRSKL